MKLAGIEIGGTKLQIVVGNENGLVQDRIAHTIDAAQGASVIRKLIEEALKKFGKVDGVGVGFGGPVNRLKGEIWTSYHVKGWTGFNISGWLHEITGVEVALENDANVAALGEAVCGAGRDHRVVFYATLGSGVGGGIIIDKKIYHGRIPGEVEFGHVRLDRTGRTVQESCSGWAVNEKIRVKAGRGKLAELALQYKGTEARALLPAMKAGDANAIEIFNELVSDLGFGLSHVVHLFHPDIIIIGGGLSFIGDVLVDKTQSVTQGFTMDAFRSHIRIALSNLRTDSVPVGALILAGQQTNHN